MNLDLGPAFTRAQALVNGLVAAIPGFIIGARRVRWLRDQMVASNYEATVEDIQARATVIRTYDGRRVVDGDDIDRARGLILEAVRGTEGVLAEPAPDVLLMDFAHSSISLRVRWCARQREEWPAGNTDAPASRKVADAIQHMSGSTPRRAEGE